MNTAILGLLAETSIHPGSGKEVGFVDLPVAREAAADYPVIVGSSFKGALLDRARQSLDKSKCNDVFGQQEQGGALIVSDARLLLLPVRSMTSHYKWITCPHLLERLRRDQTRAGLSDPLPSFDAPPAKGYLGKSAGAAPLFLEERQFTHAGELPEGLAEAIGSMILHEATRARLPEQLVVLADEDFTWFARFGLSINARNVLDTEKKTSKNLWYEETIPPDALFYCLLAERSSDSEAIKTVLGLFEARPYIQVGGNATVGQGWFAVQTQASLAKTHGDPA